MFNNTSRIHVAKVSWASDWLFKFRNRPWLVRYFKVPDIEGSSPFAWIFAGNDIIERLFRFPRRLSANLTSLTLISPRSFVKTPSWIVRIVSCHAGLATYCFWRCWRWRRAILLATKVFFSGREVKRHKMSQTAETLPTQYHRGQLQGEFPLQLPSISSSTMVFFQCRTFVQGSLRPTEH